MNDEEIAKEVFEESKKELPPLNLEVDNEKQRDELCKSIDFMIESAISKARKDERNKTLEDVLKILDDVKKLHMKRNQHHSVKPYKEGKTFCEYICFEEINILKSQIEKLKLRE